MEKAPGYQEDRVPTAVSNFAEIVQDSRSALQVTLDRVRWWLLHKGRQKGIRRVLFISTTDNHSFFKEGSLSDFSRTLSVGEFQTNHINIELAWSRHPDRPSVFFPFVTQETIDKIKRERPDLIVGWENAGVLFALNLLVNERPHNVCLDLGIPILLLWDTTLTQAIRLMADHRAVRRLLSAPNVFHFSHDPGDVARVRETFRPLRMDVQIGPHPTAEVYDFPNPAATYSFDITHVGNISLHQSQDYLKQLDDPHIDVSSLTALALKEKAQRLSEPLFDVFRRTLVSLNVALTPRDPDFWLLYEHLSVLGNAQLRLNLFEEIGRKVHFFGCYSDSKSADHLKTLRHIEFHEAVHHGQELAKVYRSSRINLILCNMINQDGYSPKFVDCSLAGGFALLDYRPCLEDVLGSVTPLITYGSIGEAKEKVDFYLSDENRRMEILAEVQKRVRKFVRKREGAFRFYVETIRSRGVV